MSTRQDPNSFEKMVLHNHRRLRTPLEKRDNYEYGMMYCARYGYEKFKKMGKNSLFFNLTIFIFYKTFYFLI